ncbi:glycosyltransferase [Streptomyces sp. NPDC102441]|uniref:glycosyltransferase n=1 Tax=Streptomyces sp. NPDC102441 TaxID=3366176 RepID=UPI00382C3BA0
MRAAVNALIVAVPAHDEAEGLAAALSSIRRAMEHCRRGPFAVPVLRLVVAADSCTDATAATAARCGADVVEISRRMAGAARAAAVAQGLESCGTHPETTWIATTDADCQVPPAWLAHQLHCARTGYHCVLGTVRISAVPHVAPAVRALHDAHYFAGRSDAAWSHPHVHGANLGIRADTYLHAGGFRAVPHSEDRFLVDALAPGTHILRTDACPVLTSGRTAPRAPHGFGTFLHDLGQPTG